MSKDELSSAEKYFNCFDLITNCPKKSLIISRYATLPFYKDVQREVENCNSKLINDYRQHRYIADLNNYVHDLGELTPKLYYSLQDLPDNKKFILKGETNSFKSHWQTMMFAQDKKHAIMISNKLSDDMYLGQQKICIRDYVELYKYFDGINGMPVTKEFRFFIVYNKIVAGDFYWHNYVEDIGFLPDVNEVPKEFLEKIISIVGSKSNFYTIDVAQKLNGDWIVIELNEGQQSDLSCIDSNIFYKNLQSILNEY